MTFVFLTPLAEYLLNEVCAYFAPKWSIRQYSATAASVSGIGALAMLISLIG